MTAGEGMTERDEAADQSEAMRATTPSERRWAFRILFVSLACLGTGQTVIFAILPPLARELGLSEFKVGAMFMVSAICWMLTSPFWGRYSDRIGRKPVILIGIGGFTVSTFIFAGLLDWGLEVQLSMLLLYPLLIAARTIYGTLGPGAMSAGQAYVADRTTREARTNALASIGAAFVLGTTLGPGLVAIFSGIGLLAPLYAVACLGLISMAAVWRFLPERTAPKERAPQPRMRFLDPRIRTTLAIGMVLATMHAIPVQTVTFFLLDHLLFDAKLAAQNGGLALMSSSLAMLAVQLFVLRLIRRSPEQLMAIGAVVCAAGFAILTFGPGYISVLIALIVIGLGFAMARAGNVGAASLSVGPEEQGAVAGLISATGGTGFIFGPLIAFPLYGVSPVAPYIFCLVVTVGLTLWLMAQRRRQAVR